MQKSMYDYGIGNTPLFQLPPINGNKLFIKTEATNFLGSIKSRTAYALVDGLDIAKVPKDCTIIETSSGNLGIALDFFCKEEGRAFFCLLDETIVPIKLDYLISLGVNCEIVPTQPGLDARQSRMKRADALTSDCSHFWVNQCDNEYGVAVHRDTTAKEIYEQTSGAVTSIFCSVGSGGTVSGVGEYFSSNARADSKANADAQSRNVKVIGVEPCGSTIFHHDEGLYISSGAGLRGKPANIERHADVIFDSYAISDSDSIDKYKTLNNELKINAGLSSGMVYAAAVKFCETARNETIVLIAADGAHYYSEYL